MGIFEITSDGIRTTLSRWRCFSRSMMSNISGSAASSFAFMIFVFETTGFIRAERAAAARAVTAALYEPTLAELAEDAEHDDAYIRQCRRCGCDRLAPRTHVRGHVVFAAAAAAENINYLRHGYE
jgi:hypothetical protein